MQQIVLSLCIFLFTFILRKRRSSREILISCFLIYRISFFTQIMINSSIISGCGCILILFINNFGTIIELLPYRKVLLAQLKSLSISDFITSASNWLIEHSSNTFLFMRINISSSRIHQLTSIDRQYNFVLLGYMQTLELDIFPSYVLLHFPLIANYTAFSTLPRD